MLITAAVLYLALPPIIATTYALLWPKVPSRVGLFITLDSVLGAVIALGTLFWVAQPLVGVGIAQARPGEQPDTFSSMLGLCLLAGVIIEVAGVYLVLVLLARMLRHKSPRRGDL